MKVYLITLFLMIFFVYDVYAFNEDEMEFKSDLVIREYDEDKLKDYMEIKNIDPPSKVTTLNELTNSFEKYNWSVYGVNYNQFIKFLNTPNYVTLNSNYYTKCGFIDKNECCYWLSYYDTPNVFYFEWDSFPAYVADFLLVDSLCEFMDENNLENILKNEKINDELINYSCITVDEGQHIIIWLQTKNDNYFLLYDVKRFLNLWNKDFSFSSGYKFCNSEYLLNRFETKNANIFVNNKKLSENAIVQDNEREESILIPIRIILENIGANNIQYFVEIHDNGFIDKRIEFIHNDSKYIMSMTSGSLLVKNSQDDKYGIIGSVIGRVDGRLIGDKYYMRFEDSDFLDKLNYKIEYNRNNNFISISKK